MNQMSMTNVKQVAHARKNYHQLCCSAELFSLIYFCCLLYGADWFIGPVSKLVCNFSQHQTVENVSCELALKKEHHQAANEPAEQTETKRGAECVVRNTNSND